VLEVVYRHEKLALESGVEFRPMVAINFWSWFLEHVSSVLALCLWRHAGQFSGLVHCFLQAHSHWQTKYEGAALIVSVCEFLVLHNEHFHSCALY